MKIGTFFVNSKNLIYIMYLESVKSKPRISLTMNSIKKYKISFLYFENGQTGLLWLVVDLRISVEGGVLNPTGEWMRDDLPRGKSRRRFRLDLVSLKQDLTKIYHRNGPPEVNPEFDVKREILKWSLKLILSDCLNNRKDFCLHGLLLWFLLVIVAGKSKTVLLKF